MSDQRSTKGSKPSRIFDVGIYPPGEIASIERVIDFDRIFYAAEYQDVAADGMDVLEHYLRFGVNEGRRPADQDKLRYPDEKQTWLEEVIGFDPVFYANTYPDVAADLAGHFIRHGIRERRLPFNTHDNLASEKLLGRIFEKLNIKYAAPLEQCAQLEAEDWAPLAQELLAGADHLNISPKPYRNNFWLGMAISYLASGELGSAACCYNFFFNFYVPNYWMGNADEWLIATARITKVADAMTSHGSVLAIPKVIQATIVEEPLFLNRPSNAQAPIEIELPTPIYGTLSDVEAIGGTSLITQSAHAVLYDYSETGPRARELQCPNLIHLIDHRCSYYLPTKSWSVEEAYWMLHDHGHNYHHWLLEILPRYLIARENGLSPLIPLLVSKDMAPQMKEILTLICGAAPPVIEVGRGSSVKVGCLHVVTDICVNTVHTKREPLPNDILISPTVVAMLRALATSHFRDLGGKLEHVQIIRRNVEHRRLVNRDHFETTMSKAGLWAFDPGEASWAQQVAVFSNARLIVAEAGAALANLVFCRPGGTVIVLVQGHRCSNYYYLCQLANLVGVRLFFFECLRLEASHWVGVQEDMIVPLSDLATWVKRFVADPDCDPIGISFAA